MNAQELIVHYDAVLAADEWILWNPVAWTVIEPMGHTHSLDYVGDLVSGPDGFRLAETRLKDALEDEESEEHLYLEFFEGSYFFFDTSDLIGTQERLARSLGENAFIWGIRWEAGAVRRRFFHAIDGEIRLRMTDILGEPEPTETTPLAEEIAEVRSAWRASSGRYRDSALLALISLTSGAFLTTDWLSGDQKAFMTESLGPVP